LPVLRTQCVNALYTSDQRVAFVLCSRQTTLSSVSVRIDQLEAIGKTHRTIKRASLGMRERISLKCNALG
jgi:hypothetical protein